MIETSLYHSLLRVAALVVAVMLVFEAGLLSPATARLANQTELFLANAVGVSVGVSPTELNQLTAALTERERELAARELALAQREIAVELNSGGSLDRGTIVLAVVLSLLLLLILLNYTLDFIRAREQQFTQKYS